MYIIAPRNPDAFDRDLAAFQLDAETMERIRNVVLEKIKEQKN